MKISSTKTYINPNEAAYNKIKYDDLFLQSDWDEFAQKGEIESFIATMDTNKLPSFEELENKYHYTRMDAAQRWLVRYNQLYADNVDKKNWSIEKFDPKTSENYKTNFYGTEYEYNEELLKNWVDYDNVAIKYERENEIKEGKSWLEKGFWTAVTPLGHATLGIVSFFENIFDTLDAAGIALGGWISGKNEFSQIPDVFVKHTSDDYYLGMRKATVDFAESIAEFERNNTYHRDIYGNIEEISHYINGTFEVVGELLPSILITYITAGIGAGTTVSAAANGTKTIASSSKFAKAINAFSKGSDLISKSATVISGMANVISKVPVGQILYYGGNFGAMTGQYAQENPSASSTAIIARSSINTLFSVFIERTSAQLLGTTAMDRLVFGMSGNKSKLTGIARVAVDRLSEGVEEGIEEFTSWFTDQALSYINGSGIYAREFSFEDLANAFIIGTLSASLLGGLDSLSRSLQEAGDLRQIYAKSKEEWSTLSLHEKIEQRNFVKRAYDYSKAVNTALYAADANEADIQLATSVYSSFRLYTKMMTQFTPEQFAKAQELLETFKIEFKENEKVGKGYLNQTGLKDFVVAVDNILTDVQENERLKFIEESKVAIEKAEKELEETKQREILDAFINEELKIETGKEPTKRAKKATKIIKDNKDINAVVVTKKGTGVVVKEGIMFVPKDAIENAPIEELYKTTAERRLVRDAITALNKIDTNLVKDIEQLYEKQVGKENSDEEKAITALCFDKTFYRICLYSFDRRMFNVLSVLNKLIVTVSGKNFDDAEYRNSINKISENMRGELRIFLSYLPKVEYNELIADEVSIFTKDDILFIEKQRYEQDVIAESVLSNKLTANQRNVLYNKINSLTIPYDEKQLIFNNLQDAKEDVRKRALYQLNSHYNGIFEGKYNDEIYPKLLTQAHSVFATFLQNENIILKDIRMPTSNAQFINKVESIYGNADMKNKIRYVLDAFNGFVENGKYVPGFGNNNYTLSLTAEGKYSVSEKQTFDSDFIDKRSRAALIEGVPDVILNNSNLKFARPIDKEGYKIYTKTINSLLSNRITKVERQALRIDDIIRNPAHYLKVDVRNQIEGTLNRTNTFAYLSKVLSEASGGAIGIELRQDGVYQVAAYNDINTFMPNAKNMLKEIDDNKSKKPLAWQNAGTQRYLDEHTNLFLKFLKSKNGVHSISEFIDNKFLPGKLKDVKIHFKPATKDNVGSSYQNGIITIRPHNQKTVLSDEQLLFAIMHEFEHAIQDYNNWNTGFDIIKSDTAVVLLKDLFEHVPDLFEGYTINDLKDNEKRKDILNIANDYIYYSTNELGANGLRTKDGFNTYNQIIVQETETTVGTHTGVRTDIVFPWGNIYSITGASIKKLNALSDEGEVLEIIPDKYLTDFNNYKNYLSKLDIALAELYAVTGSNMLTEQLIENLDTIYKDTDNLDKITIEIFKTLGIIHDEKNEFYLRGVDQNYIYRTNLKNAVNKNIFKGNDKDIDNFVKWFNNFDSVEYYSDSIYFDYADYTHYIDTVYNKLIDFNISLNIKNVQKLLNENRNKDVKEIKNKIVHAQSKHDKTFELNKTVFAEQYDQFDSNIRKYWTTPIGKENKYRYKVENLFKTYNKPMLELFKRLSFEKYHRKYFSKLTYEEMLEMEVPFFRIQEGPYRDNSLRSIFMSFNPYEKLNINSLLNYIDSRFDNLAGTNYYITIGTIKIKDVAYMYITDYEAIADLTKAKYYKNFPIHIGTNSHLNSESEYDPTSIISDITRTPMRRRHTVHNNLNYDLGYVWDKDFLEQEKISEIDIILEEGHVSKLKDFTEKQIPSHTHRKKRTELPTNEGRRQVSRKSAKDTLLENYVAKVGKGENLPQISPNMQTFLKTSKASKLDKRLLLGDPDTTFRYINNKLVVTSINDGNLLQNQVMRFLRKADKIDDYTFEQINKAFFKNSEITSLEELDNLIAVNLGDAYAIRAVLRGTEYESISHTQVSLDAMRKNIESFKASPTFAKYIAKEKGISERFYDTPMDHGYLRAALMKHYDGTIDSLAAVAGFAKAMFYENRKTADQWSAESLDRNLKDKKGNDDDRTMYDKIKGGEDTALLYESDFDLKLQRVVLYFEQLATEVVDNQIEERNKKGKTTTDEQRQKAIDKNLSMRLAKLLGEEYNANKSLKDYKNDVLGEDSDVSEKELDKWYARVMLSEMYDLDENKLSKDIVEIVTPSAVAISKRIRGKINNMTKHLVKNPKQYDNLSAEMQELIDPKTFKLAFDDDGSVLKGLSLDKLVELDKIVLEQSQKVYANSLMSKHVQKTNERVLKENTKLQNKNAKLEKQVKTYKNKATKLEKQIKTYKNKATKKGKNVESNIVIISSTEIPPLLDKIMNVSLSQYSKSLVQFINDKDDYHLRASMKEFYTQNSENFEQMTTVEALEIVKFLANHMTPDLSSKDARVWTSFAEYTLAYIYEQVFEYNNFEFTEEERDYFKIVIENARAVPGSAMSAVRHSMEMVNPVKVVLMNLKSWNNIETDDLEPIVNKMLSATKKNDYDALQKANDEMYKALLKKYRDNEVVDIYDKILKFQHAAMLSAPRTWLRNQLSDVGIKYSNAFADWLGKKVHESFRKSRVGIKVNKFLKKRDLDKLEKSARKELGENATAKQIVNKMQAKHVNLDEQYDFANIKVSDEVKGFTKANIIDTKLLDMISDALTKYNDVNFDYTEANTVGATRTQTKIVKSIVNSLKSKISMTQTYENEKINHLINLVFYAQSDDKWIKNTAIQYFNKMIQQDVNINKLDLTKGMNERITGMMVQAYSAAAYDYIHRENFINTFERALLAKNKKVYFAWKLIMPFGSSAWNWFIESLDYTPLGLFKGIYELSNLEQVIIKREDAIRKGDKVSISPEFSQMYARRSIGKGIIGTALMMFGMMLAHFGVIDIDDRDDKLKVNIKGTDFWINTDSVFLSSSIMIGAQLTNPRKGNFEKLISDTVDLMLDDTLFSSIADLTKYGLGNWAVNFVPNTLLGFIPNIWKSAVKLRDNHEIAYSSGFEGRWQYFLSQTLPFIADLPKYIDPFTGEWKSKYSIPSLFQVINLFSPIDVKNYSISDIEKVYAEHELRKEMLQGDDDKFKKLGVKLDIEILNKKYGELNNKFATEFINNKRKYEVKIEDKNGKTQYKELYYKDMTFEQRKSVLNRITTKNANYAKIYTWTQMGHKYYCNSKLRSELATMGITKNVFIGDKGYVK